MAIDLDGANVYFGSSVHTKSEEWTRLLATRRTAAIAHAQVMIELFIGEDALDTTTTSSADFPRYDAAVYEQALWLLQKQAREAENRATALKSTGGSFAKNIAAVAESERTIALDAIRFLVQYPRVIRLVKG